MPRINAATVREHRERMIEALLDAAEVALAGSEPVTVADLSARVGIARNSFYKYFDSAAAVVEQVAERRFRQWADQVESAVEAHTDPLARVLAYVDASLDIAVADHQAWRDGLVRMPFSDEALARIAGHHGSVVRHLDAALEPLRLPRPQFAAASIQAIVEVGYKALAVGEDPAATRAYVRRAVTALMTMGRPDGTRPLPQEE
jgi:AcrR family transcriptional regulator